MLLGAPPGHESQMAKRVAKRDLPVKTCAVCRRPFVWRKKWEKVWEDVKYCSDACRAQKHLRPG